MSKQNKKKKTKSARKRGRFSRVTIVLAAIVVAAAAITVVSRQVVKGKGPNAPQAGFADTRSSKKYVAVNVAGRQVQVDSQSGQVKPLTSQEAKELADGLKVMLNRSTEGLVQEQQEDGSVSMDLQGRFQNVAVARVNEDGSITQSCVDNSAAAAAFFGIDPKLLGVESTVNEPKQAAPKTSVKKVLQ
jgi:hypothetical protein